MKKQSCILLIAAILLSGRFSGLAYNGIPWYEDPCYTNIVTTACSGGSLSLTNVQVPKTNCLGDTICASVNTITNFGTNTTISIWIAASTNCPNSTNTSSVTPNVLSNWWTVAGPGNFTNTGSGLSACFTPTNRGSGTVTFNEAYQNGCDTNTQTTSASGSFTVNQFKVRFVDYPWRYNSSLPWTWEAKLEVVCTGNSNTLATMTYGFSIDANGNVSKHKSGDGTSGVGTIVVTLWDDQHGTDANGNSISGIQINAYYIGCCDSPLNWRQTLTTDTVLILGEQPPPSNDHLPGGGPWYFAPGGGQYGIDTYTSNYP